MEAAFWGLASIFAAWLITYAYFKLAARSANVDWLPVSATSLLTNTDSVRAGFSTLTITIDEHRAESPNLIIIRIVNTGSATVDTTSFDPPLEILFDSSCDFAQAAIGPRARENATITVSKTDGFLFRPGISSLNAREWFDMIFITDSVEPSIPVVRGQVKGQRSVVRNLEVVLTERLKKGAIVRKLAGGLFLMSLVVWLVLTITGIAPRGTSSANFFAGAMLWFFVIWIWLNLLPEIIRDRFLEVKSMELKPRKRPWSWRPWL